jgi:hypothetical protein
MRSDCASHGLYRYTMDSRVRCEADLPGALACQTTDYVIDGLIQTLTHGADYCLLH